MIKWLLIKLSLSLNIQSLPTFMLIASLCVALLFFLLAIVWNWWLDMRLVDEFSSIFITFNRRKIRVLAFTIFVFKGNFALSIFNYVSCASKMLSFIRIRTVVKVQCCWMPTASMLLDYYWGNILWIIFFFSVQESLTMDTFWFFFLLIYFVF